MLAPILALVLTPVAYSFPTEKPVIYDVSVKFQGYVPLLGGQEGDVEVNLGYEVLGVESKEADKLSASGDITSFKLAFQGQPLPFTVDSVRQYFPKTTVSFTPQGLITKSDPPDIQLPVKLPGLDVKRFPDITYLPVEFPAEGIEQGKEWKYTKPFGDSKVSYTITPTAVKDDAIEMDVALTQTYDSYEDSSRNPLPSSKDAVSQVSTKVDGKGKAIFDRKLNMVRKFEVTADAVSKVTNLKTKATEDRKLKTVLGVALRDAQPAPASPPRS